VPPMLRKNPAASHVWIVPHEEGDSKSDVSLGTANGEMSIATDCKISDKLSPKMILLYGDFRPFLDRTMETTIKVEAIHDTDAVVMRTYFHASSAPLETMPTIKE